MATAVGSLQYAASDLMVNVTVGVHMFYKVGGIDTFLCLKFVLILFII